MSRLIIRLVINAVALWVANALLSGMEMQSDAVSVVIVAVVFGLVNALVKPIASVLSCPLTVLTLGLFTLVINAAMLALTAWLARGLLAFNSFLDVFIAAIIVSVVSFLLSMLLGDRE